jgi:hypothetical protein
MRLTPGARVLNVGAMNASRIAVLALSAALLVILSAGPVNAGTIGGAPLFSPRVPVSAFGLARDWFDPSRVHVSSMVSVGSSGWGSRGTSALQVTTLSYSFKAPVAMSVSLGNAWGTSSARSGQSFYLQGFSLAYQPSRSVQFQIQYQDLRSPLQFRQSGFGTPGHWGY